MISVIVPAHNEANVIDRLLAALTNDPDSAQLDVLVVCNGCTDSTADIARAFGQGVRVIETPLPSKYAALKLGDLHARGFPRFYVDADVVVKAIHICKMATFLADSRVLACAPERKLELRRSSPVVRSYYQVWMRLPQVQNGLFGRGVVGVSELGHLRIASLAPMMSDDLAFSELFTAAEKKIIPETTSVIYPPRSAKDLIRRRARVATGNRQADSYGLRGEDARTSVRALLKIVIREPSLAPSMLVFIAVTAIAHFSASRAASFGDFDTWNRDESSRIVD